MNILILLDNPPYGAEHSYSGLRLALSLAKEEGVDLKVYLTADAVACAKTGQKTPEGYYNVERMLKGLATRGVPVGA